MKNRQPKDKPIHVRVDPDMLGKIDALKKRLKVTSRAEVLRRGLPYLVRHLEALAVNDPAAYEATMMGDELTLEWKRDILEAVGAGKSLAKAARAAKITQRTVYNHLDSDPVFRMLFEESKTLCVENVVEKLYDQATKEKPNITAILAFLNANHPDYGQIRTQVLQRVLGPFLERIVRLAEEFVPAGRLHEFTARLGRDAECVALESTCGKR